MSSLSIPFSARNSGRVARRFHLIEFLIKSSPALSVAFIGYVTLRGVLW